MCKNDTRDACDGVFYTGDLVCLFHSILPCIQIHRPRCADLYMKSNAPCPGDSTIRCCVTFENMNNGTGGDGSSNSSDPSSSNGLTGSQIGGIVGGVVGGVIAFAALFLILFFGCWRKRQRDHQVSVVEIPSDRDRKEEENSGRGIFMSEVEAREVGELDAGNERRELDGHGQAVYELEGVSPVDDRKQ